MNGPEPQLNAAGRRWARIDAASRRAPDSAELLARARFISAHLAGRTFARAEIPSSTSRRRPRRAPDRPETELGQSEKLLLSVMPHLTKMDRSSGALVLTVNLADLFAAAGIGVGYGYECSRRLIKLGLLNCRLAGGLRTYALPATAPDDATTRSAEEPTRTAASTPEPESSVTPDTAAAQPGEIQAAGPAQLGPTELLAELLAGAERIRGATSPPAAPQAAGERAMPELLAELLLGPEQLRVRRERKRPIVEHLADYRAALQVKGIGAKHLRDTFRRVRVMVRLCRARTYDDLQTQAVRVALVKLLKPRGHRPRRRSGGKSNVGLATANHYLLALKTFCHWMVSEGRAEGLPFRSIKKFNAETDVRVRRRTLTLDEATRLVNAATAGKTMARISGAERALGYVVALTTGLRSGELQSLRKTSFRIEEGANPCVVVEAHETKGKRRAVLPLRADVAAKVRAHLEETGRTDQIIRRSATPMRLMRKDLEAAGIPYIDANGERADFHALRHTFVTALFQSGAGLKEAQTLARHQDPKLTLLRYAHAEERALQTAVEALPSILPAAGKSV